MCQVIFTLIMTWQTCLCPVSNASVFYVLSRAGLVMLGLFFVYFAFNIFYMFIYYSYSLHLYRK